MHKVNRALGQALLILVITACAPFEEEAPAEAEPAQAEAGPIQSQIAGTTVELNATESTGTDISYHWQLRSTPGDSVPAISNLEAKKPTFSAYQPGAYVAQLIVIDSGGGTSKDFTVVNVAATEGSSQGLVDHTGFKQACNECHNGIIARGRPSDHIEATVFCVVCHSTLAWTPNIAIDHNEIFGVCTSCHNDIRVLGKPVNHIVTTAECNQCHIAGTTFSVAAFPGAAMDSGFDVGILNDDDDDDEGGSNGDHPPIGGLMCVNCHNNSIEEGKESDHILTTDLCEACHTTRDWERFATVDHTQVIGVCSSCHSKPGRHITTTLECNACHGTAQWTPTISGGTGSGGTGGTGTGGGTAVDHSRFTSTTICMNCHDGTTATGKPLGHVVTSSDCDTCHSTVSWASIGGGSGSVDHSNFTQQTVCMNCHNGSNATGKPLGHFLTSNDCDICHMTTSFSGRLVINHSSFTMATVCMDCHNGVIAEGKDRGHVVTTLDCDACHNTRNFD